MTNLTNRVRTAALLAAPIALAIVSMAPRVYIK